MNTIHRNLSSRYVAAILVLSAANVSAPTVTFAAVIADQPAVIVDSAIVEERSLLTPNGDPCQSVEHVVAWNGVTSRSCDTTRF